MQHEKGAWIVNIGGNPVSHLMDMFNGWNITGPEVYRCLNYIQKQYRYLRFYLLGLNLSCDCVDYEILKHTWNTPVFGALQGVHCIDHNTGLTKPINTINMIDVVCELPDRCPSSCQCVYRPDNTTLHIYCSTANLSSLPLDLPPLPKSDVRYKLDFSNNKRLQHVGHRPYFLNTSILDISNCSISEVTMDVLEDLSHINVADFRGNLLQSFSRKADTLNISAKLLLGLNPWRCPCDDSWMIQWLQSLSSQILDRGDIICRSPARMYGRNVLESTEYEFCVDPVQRILTITLSIVIPVIVVFIIIGIMFYKLREKCYKKWKFHPFDRDECVGEDMDYDVFLCCSSEDDDPHALRILHQMESNGYRVCYHERDFLPGSLITDKMVQSVERSKRTVCLISNNFLHR